MRKVKEIWVKFYDEKTYSENEGKLSEILDKAPGNCAVNVYDTKSKSIKNLTGHSFDERQVSLLSDVFGEENVKYQEKKMGRCRIEDVPKINQILPCNHDMYAMITDSDGEKYKRKVLMYALCDDGEVYPLYFDNEFGVSPLYDAAYDVDEYEIGEGEI